MTAAELAERLNGMTYGDRIEPALLAQARADGLVIVFGASDDLIEFEGAIDDEAGASSGEGIRVDAAGIEPNFETLCDDYDQNGLRDYFRREPGFRGITMLWCAEAGYSWTYRTDITHFTFEIVEDGEPYCRGLVFNVADL